MASILGTRNFISVQDNGATRAQRLADIYIASHTDEGGDVNDANVYQTAIDTYLMSYGDNLAVQKKILGYQNKMKDLSQKNQEEDLTLATFKRNLVDAVYVKGESLRDPATMAYSTSESLDNIVVGLNAAIDYYEAKNKSADKLIDYRKEVLSLANAERQLVNSLGNDTLPSSLDGYGYYVQTNPIDGSLVGAALLPVNYAPKELTDNTKRIESTMAIGTNNAQLPVYLPVTQDASGEYEARLYDNVWSGTSQDPVLTIKEAKSFSDKTGFNLSDASKFPIKKTDLSTGGFGKVIAGVQDGQTKYNYFYRGFDNKVYTVDEEGFNLLQQDPTMSKQISNKYIPLLSSDEIKSFGTTTPLSAPVVKTSGLHTNLEQAKLEAARASEKAAKFETGALGVAADIGEGISKAGKAVGGFFSNIFNRKNRQNQPEQPKETVSGANAMSTPYSTQDVIEKGKGFFSNLINQ